MLLSYFRWNWIEFLIIIFVGIIFIIYSTKLSSPKFTTIRIDDTKIKAEIADSYFKKILGLMFREKLNENEGMLFPFFFEGHHGIWMFGMRFPVDVVWMDKNYKIVDIRKDVKPCRIFCKVYKPKEKAKYVLELPANFTEENKINIGNIFISNSDQKMA